MEIINETENANVEVIEPQETVTNGEVVDVVEETVAVLDESSLLLAQSLVSYTASMISELKITALFESKKDFKTFVESKVQQVFSIFFGDNTVGDIDINILQDGSIEIEFQMSQGEVILTDKRLPVTTFLKVQ